MSVKLLTPHEMPSLPLDQGFQGTQNTLKLTGPPLYRKHFMSTGHKYYNFPDLPAFFHHLQWAEVISLAERAI